jgi:hypothetical protein
MPPVLQADDAVEVSSDVAVGTDGDLVGDDVVELRAGREGRKEGGREGGRMGEPGTPTAALRQGEARREANAKNKEGRREGKEGGQNPYIAGTPS